MTRRREPAAGAVPALEPVLALLDVVLSTVVLTIAFALCDDARLSAVLLVGGSSRIPLISQLVSAELGRPVALDVHPKHSVALGAAVIAGGTAMVRPVVVAPTEPVPAVPSSPVASSTPVLPPPASATTAAATTRPATSSARRCCAPPSAAPR